MQYSDIEGYLRNKVFLIAVIIIAFSLGIIGILVGQTYLGIAWTFLMLSSLSLAGVATFSVPVAFHFVRIHRWWHRKRGWTYEPNPDNHYEFPKVRKMMFISVPGVLGIMYLILTAIPFIDLHTAQGILAMFFFFFVALMVSPALYVSVWILRKSGYMLVERSSGTRINAGRELESILAWIISPLVIIRIVTTEAGKFPAMEIVLFVITFVMIAIPSLAFTSFLLKERLPVLVEKLNKKLATLA
jgi:hypothetical protein